MQTIFKGSMSASVTPGDQVSHHTLENTHNLRSIHLDMASHHAEIEADNQLEEDPEIQKLKKQLI